MNPQEIDRDFHDWGDDSAASLMPLCWMARHGTYTKAPSRIVGMQDCQLPPHRVRSQQACHNCGRITVQASNALSTACRRPLLLPRADTPQRTLNCPRLRLTKRMGSDN